MDKITLHDSTVSAQILVEKESASGIKKVAGKVMADLNAITGGKTKVKEFSGKLPKADVAIVPCIVGESAFLTELEQQKKISLKDVTGKWEVYKYILLHTDAVKNLLIVAGSDKLGTIYGL
ncbi:MAG: hypothetical protein IKX87_06930, partial [Lachnospiraceae bacterium]|nr:hypothetical protein [Lachnospiraceae bacterium]